MTWCVVARGSFEDQIRAWQVKTERKLNEVPRKVVFEMFRKIVLKTPVDEGRARSNWQPSIGSPATGTIDTLDKGGNATIAKAKAILAAANAGDTIYLSNNLPYIRRLEEGYSQQAPAGMVALTVQEFAAIVKRVGLEVSIT
jgi:hypothetical protein